MTLRTSIFFLLCVTLLLNSCVLLPIPTDESKVLAGKPITEEQLTLMIPKVTTQQEVIAQLGNPNIIWEDAHVFVYNWEMRQGVLFWMVGAYYTGAGGMTDIPKHYLLLIQFDEHEHVQRITRAVRPLTMSYIDFLEEWLKGSAAQSPPGQPNQREKAE